MSELKEKLSVGQNNYLPSLFCLEECLKRNDPKELLSSFKELVNCKSEERIDLTKNPGLTIYIPQAVQNIKSKNNILITIHELSRTGAPVVALDAAKTLVKNGFFVTVVTMRRGPLLRELLDTGIPVIFDRELELIQDSKELLATSHNHIYLDTFFGAFDQMIVVTAVYYNLIERYHHAKHSIIWWLHEGTATYDNLAPLMPKKLGNSIKVYTGGEYALNQLKKYHLPYPAKILNYGVTDIYQPTPNISSDVVKFLLPGSIGTRKGQKILLDAITALPQKYQNQSEFIFIGDIVSESDIEGKKIKSQIISASHKLPNIKYIPSVSREELFNLYQKIHALVLPSLDDPMPVVATEALMLEKALLCSDTTGTSYYLKDSKNGFIFKSQDTGQLCGKIKYIIDHKDNLPTIGKQGREVYQNNFTMTIFEKNLLQVVKEAK